ncbi:PAS domain-containing sensor histidine kinase [Sabulibacter ruber]|uniref:sensor histidine kinase n=1 Tax=Sabulibacter ruber TaxID=2811901 RepID=UPI001A95EDC2|nr:PAS domain-containing sensor histidine kinase [Sabulibacter ruber]
MKESQIYSVRSNVNWEKMAKVSVDLFCTLDADGFYTYASEASRNMLGYEPWELEGKHYTDFLHPAEATKTQKIFRATFSNSRQVHLENRVLHKNGTEVRIQWSVAWSEEDETMFCVGRDLTVVMAWESTKSLTAPVYMEASRTNSFLGLSEPSGTQQSPMPVQDTLPQKPEVDLARLTKDLHRKNSDLQQFTYIVSHNLRNPVANAVGLANLLVHTDRNSVTFDKSLSFLRLSLYRMDNVLKDMNTILSIREKRETTGLEQVNLHEVTLQALSALEEQLQKAGTTVNLDITDGLTVKANKAYLYSIFSNLLSNSAKYRAEGRRLEINIKSRRTEEGTTITFSDNGSGFDLEKNRQNVFKLYKRFHQYTEGRGMGLFLIKAHLDSMGGQIEVNSKVGEGTCFQISLP